MSELEELANELRRSRCHHPIQESKSTVTRISTVECLCCHEVLSVVEDQETN